MLAGMPQRLTERCGTTALDVAPGGRGNNLAGEAAAPGVQVVAAHRQQRRATIERHEAATSERIETAILRLEQVSTRCAPERAEQAMLPDVDVKSASHVAQPISIPSCRKPRRSAMHASLPATAASAGRSGGDGANAYLQAEDELQTLQRQRGCSPLQLRTTHRVSALVCVLSFPCNSGSRPVDAATDLWQSACKSMPCAQPYSMPDRAARVQSSSARHCMPPHGWVCLAHASKWSQLQSHVLSSPVEQGGC